MTARRRKSAQPAETKQRPTPQPVDIHDGVPDRAAEPSRMRLWIAVGVFLLWGLFLLYCLLAGNA